MSSVFLVRVRLGRYSWNVVIWEQDTEKDVGKNVCCVEVKDIQMAKFIAQIIIVGAQVVGRAFSQALRQEFQSGAAAQRASKGAQEGAKTAAANSVSGLTLQEAKQILNVQDLEQELIQKNYDHLFKINEKKAGGSFYLQSKVVRAKERLDEEIRIQQSENETQKQKHDGESET